MHFIVCIMCNKNNLVTEITQFYCQNMLYFTNITYFNNVYFLNTIKYYLTIYNVLYFYCFINYYNCYFYGLFLQEKEW